MRKKQLSEVEHLCMEIDMKRFLVYIVSMGLILYFLVASAGAGTETFIREYTYKAGEADSKLSSRVIALEQVKRLLLEELGVFLSSRTEVRDFQLSHNLETAARLGDPNARELFERISGRQN